LKALAPGIVLLRGIVVKKVQLAFLLSLLCIGQLAFAQESGESDKIGLAFDGGAGISFGLMQSTGDETTDTLGGIATFLATLRGALYGTARYSITDQLSVGAQIGLYAITYDLDDGSSVTLLDLPVYGLVRYDLGPLGLEAFGGYYLSPIKSADYDFGGVEFGAKVLLGPLYASYSQVLANPSYNRIEVGFELSKMLEL